jgi:hypothetical protein
LQILAALLTMLISFKIYFYYYNTFVAWLLLAVCLVFFLITAEDNMTPELSRSRRWLMFLIVVCTILINIPDRRILEFINPQVKAWSPAIQWTDFKARRYDAADSMAASINHGFLHKRSSVLNYPPAIATAMMATENSIINAYWDGDGDSLLLAHEQTHFDINEYYARLLNDSLRHHWMIDEEGVETILYTFYNRMAREGDLYDKETSHGTNVEVQRTWSERYLDKLNLRR